MYRFVTFRSCMHAWEHNDETSADHDNITTVSHQSTESSESDAIFSFLYW